MPDARSDATSDAASQASDETPVPLMQRLYDKPFLLLGACMAIMFAFYTAWGVIEILSLDPAPLP